MTTPQLSATFALSAASNSFFTGENKGDIVMYPSTSNQRIIMGNKANNQPMLALSETDASVGGNLNSVNVSTNTVNSTRICLSMSDVTKVTGEAPVYQMLGYNAAISASNTIFSMLGPISADSSNAAPATTYVTSTTFNSNVTLNQGLLLSNVPVLALVDGVPTLGGSLSNSLFVKTAGPGNITALVSDAYISMAAPSVFVGGAMTVYSTFAANSNATFGSNVQINNALYLSDVPVMSLVGGVPTIGGADSTGLALKTTGTGATTLSSDTSIALTAPAVTVSGAMTTSNLTVSGNLIVTGSNFITNTEVVKLSDNVIVLNAGELSSTISKGHAGLLFDRGTGTPYELTFYESSNAIMFGPSDNTETLASREWLSTNMTTSLSNVSILSNLETVPKTVTFGSSLYVPTGYVGVGNSNPQFPVHVTTQWSNVSVYAAYDVTAFSDARVKTDLVPIGDALNKVGTLTGYTFRRTDEGSTDMRQCGVIAQDVQAVLPEAVHKHPETGMLSVAYGNMVSLVIEAVKELTARVTAIEAELESRALA